MTKFFGEITDIKVWGEDLPVEAVACDYNGGRLWGYDEDADV